MVAKGPDTTAVKSNTLMPVSGPGMEYFLLHCVIVVVTDVNVEPKLNLRDLHVLSGYAVLFFHHSGSLRIDRFTPRIQARRVDVS
jgi:hypothetical protein